MEKYNPLKSWRGKRDFVTAASLLHLSPFEYWELESYPWASHLDSDQIILISQTLGIPLPALVDWLTETTKEATP